MNNEKTKSFLNSVYGSGKDTISPNLTNAIAKADMIAELKKNRANNSETMSTLQPLIDQVNTDNESDYPIYQFLIQCRQTLQNRQLRITADLLDLLL